MIKNLLADLWSERMYCFCKNTINNGQCNDAPIVYGLEQSYSTRRHVCVCVCVCVSTILQPKQQQRNVVAIALQYNDTVR
jgi:hypothetical protein